MVKRALLVAAARGYTSLRPSGALLDEFPEVMLIEHMAALFDCSAATIARRVCDGTFPVPPLAAIDRRLRWSRSQVRSWLDTGDPYALASSRRTGRRAPAGRW